MTRAREGLVLAYAAHSERGAPQHPSPFAEEARAALGAEWEDVEEQLFGPDEALHAAIGQLRDELLSDVQQIGARLGELRLDTDLDVAHGVTRYLELLKLAALHARPEGQDVADALPGINAAILHAATAQQREILQTSSLDDVLLDGERDAGVRAKATAARHEPSLAPFLPRRGDGLALSASDIETYRDLPVEVQVRARLPGAAGADDQPALRDRRPPGARALPPVRRPDRSTSCWGCWRRAGGAAASAPTDEERQLHVKAENALKQLPRALPGRGRRADVVREVLQLQDRRRTRCAAASTASTGCPTARYELIDYKTGRPKAPAQLRDDVQLALYAVAATQAWGLEASASPTCTCWTTRRSRCPTTPTTPSGSPRPSARSPTASSARASSRRRPTRPARSATTASPARRPSASAAQPRKPSSRPSTSEREEHERGDGDPRLSDGTAWRWWRGGSGAGASAVRTGRAAGPGGCAGSSRRRRGRRVSAVASGGASSGEHGARGRSRAAAVAQLRDHLLRAPALLGQLGAQASTPSASAARSSAASHPVQRLRVRASSASARARHLGDRASAAASASRRAASACPAARPPARRAAGRSAARAAATAAASSASRGRGVGARGRRSASSASSRRRSVLASRASAADRSPSSATSGAGRSSSVPRTPSAKRRRRCSASAGIA